MVKNILAKLKFRYDCWRYDICPKHLILKENGRGFIDYYCSKCLNELLDNRTRRNEKRESERVEFLERINS